MITPSFHTPVAPVPSPVLARWKGLLLGVVLLVWPFTTGAGPIPDQLIRQNLRDPGTELAISAPALLERVKAGQPLYLVDVRRPSDFTALHIPGAMNMALAFVKTKSQLKDRPLVVIDRGLSFQRLAPACRTLRRLGFEVRILDGGMAAWSRCHGPVVGYPAAQIDYSFISPADFFLEKDDPRRVVCDVSTGRGPEARTLMPYAIHLPLVAGGREWAGRIQRFKAARFGRPDTALIVVDAYGSTYADLAAAFEHAGVKNVFFLTGGRRAYEKYLEGLTRSWQPQKDRRLVVNPCRKCSEQEKNANP